MYVKQWGEKEQLQNILPFHVNTESFDYCKSSAFRTECPAKIQEDFVPRRVKHCIITQNVWSTFNSVFVHTIIYLVCICLLRQPENFKKPNSSQFLQDQHLTFQSEWLISTEMYFNTFSLDFFPPGGSIELLVPRLLPALASAQRVWHKLHGVEG